MADIPSKRSDSSKRYISSEFWRCEPSFKLGRRTFLGVLYGMAAGISRAVSAERPESPTIGFLSTRQVDEANDLTRAFKKGLETNGFMVGKTVEIEYRWAEFQYQRLPVLASELIGRRVTVIAAVGGAHSGLAAMKLTSVIPIIFVSAGDPIEFGLVKSLNRPEGNVTGISLATVALASKRFELLHELVPAPAIVAMLVNPTSPYFEAEKTELLATARILKREVRLFNAASASEVDAAFDDIVRQKIGALFVSGDPYFDGQRSRLVSLAARYSIPAIYQWREFANIGGLISYGTNILEAYSEAGIYVSKILKGATTKELPVLQPTGFEMVINLKTARDLGLVVPYAILATADFVIE
jgi:putative ABC transport system substrate-binding protein